MRFLIFLVFAFCLGFASLTPPAQAAPVAASSLNRQTAAPDLTEKARTYCYDTYSGRFLHWGPCYRRHYVYRRYYRRHYWRRW